MILLRRRELFFFFQPGCSHCERGRPVVEAWKWQQFSTGLLVVLIDVTLFDEPKYRFKIRMTPSYMYAENGEVVRSHEGLIMRDTVLDKLVAPTQTEDKHP